MLSTWPAPVSEPAAGSVRAKQPMPADSMGLKKRLFCSSLPAIITDSMLRMLADNVVPIAAQP